MALLRHLKLALSCVYWLFTVLFAYAVGRTTNEFDWPSFWVIIGLGAAAHALFAVIWWALTGLRTRRWSPWGRQAGPA